jgi:hypothetical protein
MVARPLFSGNMCYHILYVDTGFVLIGHAFLPELSVEVLV